MSDLPGNPYGTATNVSPHEGENDGHWAIAQATLALAYEQRTANLIAFLSYAEGDTYETQWQGINARLGLGGMK